MMTWSLPDMGNRKEGETGPSLLASYLASHKPPKYLCRDIFFLKYLHDNRLPPKLHHKREEESQKNTQITCKSHAKLIGLISSKSGGNYIAAASALFLFFRGLPLPPLCSFWVWLIINWPGLQMLFSPYHALLHMSPLMECPGRRPFCLWPPVTPPRKLVPSPTRKTVTQVSSPGNKFEGLLLFHREG